MFVGIDIVQISRIQKAMQKQSFANKILTDTEIACNTHNSIQSTAASFAAKEAFSKALGTGMRGFGFGDISVLHNSMGKPYLEFSTKVESLITAKGITGCDVSISHEKEYAVAIGVAIGQSVNNVITPTIKSAKRLIDFFKENGGVGKAEAGN